MIVLEKIKRTDKRILADMAAHYSAPKGFVGRNMCYAVLHDGGYYGSICAGSAVKNLAGVKDYFGCIYDLQRIINNIFFHVVPRDITYPVRNFAQKVLRAYEARAEKDWLEKYGTSPIGHQTLVELPRTGEVYRREGWKVVGQTKGFTCKRSGGVGTDSWSGKRVWDTENLRPKLVLVKAPFTDVI